MVFADVSGFTRLSERLARRGEEGAEQLVDAINTCFSALLAEAYGRGGSLLKFGGDAMLLLFYDQEEGSGMPCGRAARPRRCGARCVTWARSAPERATSCCGCPSACTRGAYPMFVVGDSHREVVIAGPAASAVVAMEGAASSGQILMSPDTARHLPRASVGRGLGPGLLLGRTPADCAWVPPAGLPESVRGGRRELHPGGGEGTSAGRVGGSGAPDGDDRVPAVRRLRSGAGRERAGDGGATTGRAHPAGPGGVRHATTSASSTPTSPSTGARSG